MSSHGDIKKELFAELKKTVNAIFIKRGFADSFTADELSKIKEIDAFMREICLFKGEEIYRPYYWGQRIFLAFKTKTIKDGEEISVFYNKAVPVSDFDYQAIEFYVAKAVYRAICNKDIEVYYTPNNFGLLPIGGNRYMVERKKANVTYTGSIYIDIDLTGELAAMADDELLAFLKKEYKAFFCELPPTYIIRSGAGIHMYYSLLKQC